MSDNIKEFKVSGQKYGLDLEAIGSYLGNQLLKEYIDTHSSGGSSGGDYVVVNNLSEITTPKNGSKAYIPSKGEFVYDEGKWWWVDVIIDNLTQEEIAAYVAQLLEGNFYNNIKTHPNRFRILQWDTRTEMGTLCWGGDTVYGVGVGSANGMPAFETFSIERDGSINRLSWSTLPFLPQEADEGAQFVLQMNGGILGWQKIN